MYDVCLSALYKNMFSLCCVFMDHLCCLCLVLLMLSRLFIAALGSPAGKELISWLLFVMFKCVFVTFQCGIRGQFGTWFYRCLIFAAFLTLVSSKINSRTILGCVCPYQIIPRYSY